MKLEDDKEFQAFLSGFRLGIKFPKDVTIDIVKEYKKYKQSILKRSKTRKV